MAILRQVPRISYGEHVKSYLGRWLESNHRTSGSSLSSVAAPTGSVDSTMTVSCTCSRIITYECAERISTCAILALLSSRQLADLTFFLFYDWHHCRETLYPLTFLSIDKIVTQVRRCDVANANLIQRYQI